jgi:spermidine synthase
MGEVHLASVNSPGGAPNSARRLPWLLLLFFGSGCAALIYEVVWLQVLQLVLGLTTVSLGLLLGAYMGGLCLGSLLWPRFISRRHHPLRVYALLELGIGAIGLALLFLLPWVAQVYTQGLGRGFPGLLLRGVVAALCLLPPTVLMGATLPAIARWVQMTPAGVSWLGFFYGGNIAGAVFGCLLAGFYLLRVYDPATATYVAAAINGVVALAALALAARATQVAPAEESAEAPAASPPNRWAVYTAIGLSGMAALGAEVVWTRLLSLLLGGTVYTFSIILAVFLAGLGIGSGLGSLLAGSRVCPRLALGGCQVLLLGAVGWTAHMITHSLPYWPVNPALATSPWHTFQLDLGRCLWAVFPAACLWGASFPLALAAVASRSRDSGQLVGEVYAANTVGAILGALTFSLLVIPLAGTQWAQRLLVGLSAAAAGAVLAPLLWQRATTPGGSAFRRSIATAMTVTVALAILLGWSVSAVPWGLIAYGRFTAIYAERFAPGIVSEKDVPSGSGAPDIFCTYVGEGINGSVAVTKWRSGARNFHSAGKVQASTEPRDMRLQRLLGHLPALTHPKPESVLVVACGAGITAGAFVLHPDLKRLVICDIEPLVPKVVAPMFENQNHGVLKDPRTEVVSDDGRHFLRATREQFDIIASDPIDPWVKGCAALNTVEYYQLCKAHLKPGGIVTLWMPLYESSSDTAKSLIGSFFQAFPNGTLWSNDSEGEGYDAVLFGQVEPTRIDLDKLQERLNRADHARVKESLAEAGFRSAVALLSTYAGQAPDLRQWTRDAKINTDRNLRLQYLAGLSLNSYTGTDILQDIRQYYRFPDQLFVGSQSRRQMLKYAIEGPLTGLPRPPDEPEQRSPR